VSEKEEDCIRKSGIRVRSKRESKVEEGGRRGLGVQIRTTTFLIKKSGTPQEIK
jgi:hypothetical protein